MSRLAAAFCVALLTAACDESPVTPSSPWSPRPIALGELVRARVTESDPLCDRFDPTFDGRCFSYSVTTPRDGLLEVALTWTPITAAGAAEPLGFSVTDPKGKSWSPTEAGITRQVHLPASRRDVFKINLWSMPGEEFELHTLLR